MMNVTYRDQTYTVHSEAALIALVSWLRIQDADAARIAA
jgi:hypothetical protein